MDDSEDLPEAVPSAAQAATEQTIGLFFIICWCGAVATVGYLFYWYFLVHSGASIMRKFGVRLPENFKAGTVQVTEDGDFLGVTEFDNGTVRDNPVGFAVGIAILLSLIALPFLVQWLLRPQPEKHQASAPQP